MGNSSPSEGISIVGLGLNLPGGIRDPDSFWQALLDQQVIVRPAPDRGNGEHSRIRPGAFLDDLPRFDRQVFGLSRPLAASLDPRQRLLLECSWNAMEDAGIVPGSLAGSRTGVFVGALNFGEFQGSKSEGRLTASAYGYTGGYSSFLAQRLSYSYDLRGPSLAIDTACSAGLTALHLAVQSLRREECELALVGGVNLVYLTSDELMAAMGVLSRTQRCRPFDATADGYVRGEGCIVLVLSRQPQQDPGPVYAILKGSAVGQLGKGKGISASGGPAQEVAMREALADASVSPEQVSYMEANSAGNLVGDALELTALRNVYDVPKRTFSLHIGAVRANFGHTEGASGLLSVAKAMLCIRHKFLPPQPGFSSPNRELCETKSKLSILENGLAWQGERFAGVHNYGQGGSTAHIILASPSPVAPQCSGTDYLLLVSAACEAALSKRLESYRHQADRLSDEELAALCASAARTLTDFAYRLALCAENASDLREQLSRDHQSFRPRPGSAGFALILCQESEPLLQTLSEFGVVPERILHAAPREAELAAGDLTLWVDPGMPPDGGLLLKPESRISWLQCLSGLWLRGVSVDWPKVIVRQPWISPPPYPFQGDSLPVSGTGRTQTEIVPAAEPGDSNNWLARVQQAIQPYLKTRMEATDWNLNFTEFGLDSVALLSVINSLQKSTGKRLPPSLIYQYPTAPALAGILERLNGPYPNSFTSVPSLTRVRSSLTLVLFLLALWSPFLERLLPWKRTIPDLRPQDYSTFPWNLDLRQTSNRKSLEEWMQANLGLRSLLVRSNGRALAVWLRSSSSPEVILGSNGFLFGPQTLSWVVRPQQNPKLQELLQANRRFLEARGIHYLVLRTPWKEEVYPQFLPPGYRHSYPDAAERKAFTGPGPDNLDLLPPVLSAQTRGVFERTGIHWNGLGGWAAYQVIAARLRQWYPDVHPLNESEIEVHYYQEWGADQARKLAIEDKMLEANPNVRPKHRLYQVADSRIQNDHYHWAPPTATEIPDSQLPTAVVFQDSMGERLQPLLSQHFRRVVYVQAGRPSVLNSQVIAAERPDLVIHLNPYSSDADLPKQLTSSVWEPQTILETDETSTEVVAQVNCTHASVVALRGPGTTLTRCVPQGVSWLHFRPEKPLKPGTTNLQWIQGSGKVSSYREFSIPNPPGLRDLFEGSREIVVDNPLLQSLEFRRGTFRLNLKSPYPVTLGEQWNLEERNLLIDCPVPAPGKINVWKLTWECNGPVDARFSVPVNGRWAPQIQSMNEGENVCYFRHPAQGEPQVAAASLTVFAKKCKVRARLKSLEIRAVAAKQAPYTTLSAPGQSARL